MSDDTKATLARIDRDLAESARLQEEANKRIAERHKLMAAHPPDRDHGVLQRSPD